MTGSIIAVISDTHFGSTFSPATPTYKVHTARPNETTEQTASRIQADLFEKWLDYWRYVYALAGIKGKHRKHRLILIHLGDVIDGNHHGTHQIIQEIPDQIELAANLMGEIHKQADVRIGVLGTEAHAGTNCENEQHFYTTHNYQYSAARLSIEIDGLLFDLAHHGRASGRKWSSGAAGVAAEVALDYIQAGKRPPDYVLRGHVHQIDDSGIRVRGTRAIMCPSWQLRTTYGYKASTVTLSDIGSVVFNLGALDISHARYEFPSDREVIKI